MKVIYERKRPKCNNLEHRNHTKSAPKSAPKWVPEGPFWAPGSPSKQRGVPEGVPEASWRAPGGLRSRKKVVREGPKSEKKHSKSDLIAS